MHLTLFFHARYVCLNQGQERGIIGWKDFDIKLLVFGEKKYLHQRSWSAVLHWFVEYWYCTVTINIYWWHDQLRSYCLLRYDNIHSHKIVQIEFGQFESRSEHHDTSPRFGAFVYLQIRYDTLITNRYAPLR